MSPGYPPGQPGHVPGLFVPHPAALRGASAPAAVGEKLALRRELVAAAVADTQEGVITCSGLAGLCVGAFSAVLSSDCRLQRPLVALGAWARTLAGLVGGSGGAQRTQNQPVLVVIKMWVQMGIVKGDAQPSGLGTHENWGV